MKPKPAAPQSSPLPWREGPDGTAFDAHGHLMAEFVGHSQCLNPSEVRTLVLRRMNEGPKMAEAFEAMVEASEKVLDALASGYWHGSNALDSACKGLVAALNLAKEAKK